MKKSDLILNIQTDILSENSETKRKNIGRPKKKTKLSERLILTFTTEQLNILKKDFYETDFENFTTYLRSKLMKGL